MAVLKFITKNAEDGLYKDMAKYHDEESITDLINYIFNPQKTCGYIGGLSVDVNNAAYEMELLSALYHNNNGVRLRHWVISFSDQDLMNAAIQMGCGETQAIYKLGFLFAVVFADRFQIVYAIHFNTDTRHIHFVMNNVSYIDGRKFSGSKKDYWDYVCYVKRVAEMFGMILCVGSSQAAQKHYKKSAY